MIPRHLADAGLTALADKGYQGLAPDTILTLHKGSNKPSWQATANQQHARLRAKGERAFAELKKWQILTRLRCSTHRTHTIARAIHTINHTG